MKTSGTVENVGLSFKVWCAVCVFDGIYMGVKAFNLFPVSSTMDEFYGKIGSLTFIIALINAAALALCGAIGYFKKYNIAMVFAVIAFAASVYLAVVNIGRLIPAADSRRMFGYILTLVANLAIPAMFVFDAVRMKKISNN